MFYQETKRYFKYIFIVLIDELVQSTVVWILIQLFPQWSICKRLGSPSVMLMVNGLMLMVNGLRVDA